SRERATGGGPRLNAASASLHPSRAGWCAHTLPPPTLAAPSPPLFLSRGAWGMSRAGSGASTASSMTGRGVGHGRGLGQGGALGQAKRGVPYDRILAHYYPGTKLGQASTPTIRVLLSEGTAKVNVRSASRFTVKDGAGALHKLAPGTYAIGVR